MALFGDLGKAIGLDNVDTGDALGSGNDIGNVTEETSFDVAGI